MSDYIALLHKEADSDFGVSFPDFPGCITAGSTLEEARTMAAEALAFHIEGMLQDGHPVPEPSSLDAVMSDPENRDAVAFLVPAPPVRDRAVRVNVTIPEGVLTQIDAFARRNNTSRSAFLAQAALKVLREKQGPE